MTARDAQAAFPTCSVCGGKYNKLSYYDHVKTSVRHAKAVRR